MFDKYKKYKVISAVVFIIILAIFLLTHLKIQSVQSYQDEHKKNGYAAIENTSTTISTKKEASNKNESSKNGTNFDETRLSKETQDEENNAQTELSNKDETQNAEQTFSENKTTGSSLENTTHPIEDAPNYNPILPPNSLDKTQSNSTASSDIVTDEPVVEPQYITCSIEVRCDVAVEFKDSIKNEGVKNSIPSDGTIIKKTSYKIPVGQKVYDFLMQACVDNNILVSANNGYVTSINHLSEKAISYGSGWMYKVNDVSPNVGALAYTLKEGDTVLWYYVNNGKDG